MKKRLLNLVMMGMLTVIGNSVMAQVRYIDEIFSSVTKMSDVVYDTNIAINLLNGVPGVPAPLQGPLWTQPLVCDIYQPDGDVSTNRPVILLAHTGSYLPAIINNQTTGNKNDSSIVAIATKFAKRGYVVVALNYRLGWNPTTTVQEQAQEQLLKATYRALQDVRNCIRYIRTNASTYGVDTSKIVVGGQGTGGYVSMAFGSVDKRSDIESNLKFLRGDASPMVSVDTLGDWTGVGGVSFLNISADANVSSNAHMTFNYGGAMGDTAWMDANTLPHVGLHCVGDIFAPFGTGNVVVPTTGITVIPNASGAGHVVPKANAMGVNNKINRMYPANDVSARGLALTNGINNLYPFRTPVPVEGSPWEFWDKTTMRAITSVNYRGVPLPANGRNADSLSSLTNPLMSEARGNAYCDTVVNFVAPRIALQFDLAAQHELDAFNLLSPANNATVDIYDDSTQDVVIKWQLSSNLSGNPIAYEWIVYDAAGTIFDPIDVVEVGDDTDSLVFNMADVYSNLTDLGVGIDETANLKWNVSASNDVFARLATAFSLNLTKRATVGVKESSISSFVSVYPNPTQGMLNIAMDKGMAAIASIEIMDMAGRKLLSLDGLNTHQQQVVLSSFGTGVYFANITNTRGVTATKKFIVQ